jgi:polyisoprenoid-binding protein YceI
MAGTITPTEVGVPQGTWALDTTHSSASFAVKHMVVATFRGRFEEFDATLTVGEDGEASLLGVVKADSIVVKDENLAGHLKSPDFFDTERHPEIRFASTAIRREGADLVVDGDLTIKGTTRRVEARGTITDPVETLGYAEKIGVTLEAIIDRTAYGLNWNAPLPKGGVALADDVKLIVELELELAKVEA